MADLSSLASGQSRIASNGNAPEVKPVPHERDWFFVSSWHPIWQRTGLAPQTLPGVRTAAGHEVALLAPRTDPAYARQAGASAKAPFPYRVHRSHLPVLGLAVPAAPFPLSRLDRAMLRPYQAAGAAWLRERRGALLADSQRVGKTPQVVYAHEAEAGALVVVGPVAARASWHEWAARRFGACEELDCSLCARVGAQPREDGRPSFMVLAGRTPELALLSRGAFVYFLSFATVAPWSNEFAAFGRLGTLAVDEAHLAGVQNRNGVTVQGLRRLNVVAHRTVLASGTPMWNRPSGLYPIIDLACPGSFGRYWDFARRYCGVEASGYQGRLEAKGSTNEDELEQRLSAVMLRRTWTDIQTDLPPIVRSTEYVSLSAEEHNAVFAAANAARRAASESHASTVIGDLERLRKLYAGAKVSKAAEMITEALDAGRSVIAWTWHKDVAAALSKAFGTDDRIFGPIHGALSANAREQILGEVRDFDNARCLIATMGALATAVSLNWASEAIFVELDWTPAVIQQAEMRPYDGTKPIACTFLVADCEPDRRQADALLSKLGIADALGLSSGQGDISDVLRSTLHMEPSRTLDDVAKLIFEGETL